MNNFETGEEEKEKNPVELLMTTLINIIEELNKKGCLGDQINEKDITILDNIIKGLAIEVKQSISANDRIEPILAVFNAKKEGYEYDDFMKTMAYLQTFFEDNFGFTDKKLIWENFSFMNKIKKNEEKFLEYYLKNRSGIIKDFMNWQKTVIQNHKTNATVKVRFEDVRDKIIEILNKNRDIILETSNQDITKGQYPRR